MSGVAGPGNYVADLLSGFRRLRAGDRGPIAAPRTPLASSLLPGMAPGALQRSRGGFHVEIESGTQVAPRGPTWRTATPLV
jgi:hypothetical protein